MLTRREYGERVRFAALFKYLHQNRDAFERLRTSDGLCLIDRIFILIPNHDYSAYSTQEVEELFEDIVTWLA